MKKFKKFYIEITNICNLSCNFCPKTSRQLEYMPVSRFEFILNQIKPYTDYLYFHVKGEPLLHPNLIDFLKISYKKGFQVNITTNGTLINLVGESLLQEPALRQINFSLHSIDGNNKNQTKDRQSYIEHILDFIDQARTNTKIFSSLRFWNLNQDNSININCEENDFFLKKIENHFKLSNSIINQITAGNGIAICDKVYLNQDAQFEWPSLDAEEDDGIGFCYGLRNQIAVLVDGTVVPCCLDGEGVINLGSIIDTPFANILASKRATDLFDGFSNRKAVEELCRKCGYRKKMNGTLI